MSGRPLPRTWQWKCSGQECFVMEVQHSGGPPGCEGWSVMSRRGWLTRLTLSHGYESDITGSPGVGCAHGMWHDNGFVCSGEVL